MTSKEALEYIRSELQMQKHAFGMCDRLYIESIQKDLEILEIIKYCCKKNLFVKTTLHAFDDRLKEWLANERK